VGVAYFAGALVPVLPVLFGANDALVSLVTAGGMIIVVSLLLAFLSGMKIQRRIAMNLVIIAAAVGITYMIGLLAKSIWGVSV
jgi:VIT1/CCC1 family predicted Fe2+/Mn2+ transporter